MKINLKILAFTFAILLLHLVSCQPSPSSEATLNQSVNAQKANKEACKLLLDKHLNAVSERNYDVLSSTLAPHNKMQLILPSQKMTTTVQEFLDFHKEWFVDTTWTIESKIIDMTVKDKLAIAVTEQLYKEPERNGKPYYNKMQVSYALQKIDEKWYVIRDHASSIDKTK